MFSLITCVRKGHITYPREIWTRDEGEGNHEPIGKCSPELSLHVSMGRGRGGTAKKDRQGIA